MARPDGVRSRGRSTAAVEAPADRRAIGVAPIRYGAIALGSVLVGLAGGYLPARVAGIWGEAMTGGGGWIAVALVILAPRPPGRAPGGRSCSGASRR